MPTYCVTTASGRLSAAAKHQIALAISRVHNDVTHAPLFFAQIIFHEIPTGNQFIAGRPMSPDMVFIHGYIRAGRTPTQKRELLGGIVDAAIATTTLPRGSVWAYLSELPPGQMVEYGHFLPEPGMENAWLAGLPDAERAHIARVAE